ncbi:hypothetical protein D3C80_1946000 [compost metagenome]
MNYVYNFVLDDYEHKRNVSGILKEHGEGARPGEEMTRLLESMSEKDVGLFRRMFTSGLFELMGTGKAFEFGLKLILLGIEQVIKEKEK